MCSSTKAELHPALLANERCTLQKFSPKEFKRGLAEDEEPFPISPRIGPYVIDKPVFGGKNYHWCSCGMSKKQPFCDSSHRGTKFEPLKFALDQRVRQMHLCGCKLTKQAPFCDGITCHQLMKGDPIELPELEMPEADAADTQAQEPEKA